MTIKIGIIGCGKIAQVRHIPEYADNKDCVLHGFYNPTRSRAEDMAKKYGGKVYDTPEELLSDPEIDAVITLGAVIQGETKHDEVVVAQASRKIMDLSMEFDKPVAFGVTGPGMTELQAIDRIEKGRDVVDVVVKMLKRLEGQ